MIRHFHEFFKSKFLAGFCNLSRMCAAALEPRTAFYNFTRLSLSAYFKLQLSLRSERVYTCLCRRDRQTSQVRHFSLILTYNSCTCVLYKSQSAYQFCIFDPIIADNEVENQPEQLNFISSQIKGKKEHLL